MAAHEVVHYGCDDSLTTAHLFDLFRMIMQLEGSWDFYTANEVDPAVDDAWNFIEGVTVDFQRLTELREESRVRAELAEKEIRQALSKNVNEQSATTTQQAAETLLQEWWLTDQFKFIKDGVYDAEAGTDHYNRLWGRAWNACFYEPMTATEDKKQFSPTLLGINGVIKAIDAEAPTLTKLTQDALYHYGKGLTAYIDTAVKQPRTAVELNELYSLLFNARKNLGAGKRQGNAYETFHAFCQSVLDERIKGKVQVSGTTLNFGSQPQMQQMLYGMLRLPVRRRSKPTEGSLREQQRLEGSPATGIKAVASALVWDVREGDWRRPVLENYGSVCKERQLESLYFNKYPLWQHPEDGKIHPQIRNCGTATRRPAGSNPNMLQVAKGPIRSMFPAGEGRVFVSIDLANQELVILAAECKDPVMLDAFLSNPRRDIHSVTSLSYAHNILSRRGLSVPNKLSYELFQEGLHSSDKEIAGHYSFVRNKLSKGVNFLLAYLGGYATLAENLLISQEMAKELMSQTFSLYGRVQPWQQETIEFARTHGYSEMAYGSRRHVTEAIHSEDDGVRKRMERQVVNAVVQGTAAEILKKIRQEVARTEMRERYDMRSVFMIYDEVTANIPMEKCEDYILEMAEIMRITPPGYPVGMEVDASVGKTWGTQKEIGVPTRERIREVLGEL
jgi:DNA polymerase-1